MPDCKQAPGATTPVIDRNRCEGKGLCVPACPYDVLEMHVLPVEDRRDLSLIGRIKGFAHGWKQAAVRDPDLCRACGQCVAVCPERAITLVRSSRPIV